MSKETNVQLKKEISDQAQSLHHMRTQVSKLVDRLTIIENDITTFKERVGKDITRVVKIIKEEKKNEANRY
tara:strand:- start:258 stop:470 length:213 start_codon:yes stop_codon:yes gene_type:complete